MTAPLRMVFIARIICVCSCYIIECGRSSGPGALIFYGRYLLVVEINNIALLCRYSVLFILQVFATRSVFHRALNWNFTIGGSHLHRFEMTPGLQRKTLFSHPSPFLPLFRPVPCILTERTHNTDEMGYIFLSLGIFCSA